MLVERPIRMPDSTYIKGTHDKKRGSIQGQVIQVMSLDAASYNIALPKGAGKCAK